MKGFPVSIFYPCYNDWGTVGSMVMLTVQVAEKLGLDYDLTLVDDGSTPLTLELLEEVRRQYPQVQVIRHERNRGYGGALRSGFAAGTRDWVFYTDGDAQFDVREIEVLIRQAFENVDVVQGWKISRNDPLHRIVIGRIYHNIVRFAFVLRLRDVDCDFRLLRRSALEKIRLTSDSGVICVELMSKLQRAGCRIVEVPVHHYQRAHGKSQFFNFRRIFQVVVKLAQLWLRMIVLRKND